MGVSGSGKSTIGELLSESIGIPYFDGDDFHPEANILKMQSGIPLNDDDRKGWLYSINQFSIKEAGKKGAIIACSALKHSYRIQLESGLDTPPFWVYLQGNFDLILERMKTRSHFMPPKLLQSQFDTLEPPTNALVLDIMNPPAILVAKINEALINMKSEFGLAGLGVMGKSLALNFAEKGIRLSLFNRHEPGEEEDVAKTFIANNQALNHAKGFDQLDAFVASLETPRKIFLMVPSNVTESIIRSLIPMLEEGDIIIDGGNSHFKSTNGIGSLLEKYNIHFLGTGVSGGEKGARLGPSIMPGGSKSAYQQVSKYLLKIAAKDAEGKACCTYIGPEGAGHFVKMVHNGIEYAEMQLIAEVYTICRYGLGMTPDKIGNIFQEWDETPTLNSYLMNISANILRKHEKGEWLIDKILDKAGNKGTGGWTTAAATELGVPIPIISAALFARYLSAIKDERVKAQQLFSKSKNESPNPDIPVTVIKNAYELARLINHHQGFHLIRAASKTYDWALNLSEIARIWTQGCIIRSGLMVSLIDQLKSDELILTSRLHENRLTVQFDDLKSVVSSSTGKLHIPCLSSALEYITGYTNALSSANIIQAQRDYFGAHRYQRNDDLTGQFFHTEWD